MFKIHGKHQDKLFHSLIAGRAPQMTADVNATHHEMDLEGDR
jgi:hypothetical protein